RPETISLLSVTAKRRRKCCGIERWFQIDFPLVGKGDKMSKPHMKISSACICLLMALLTATAADGPKPKHVNRAIELLEQGQPIYYTGSHSGTSGTFDQGVKDAQTWADYISYDMEHAPFDVKGLADYMKGLAKGGPTKSGHRTPAVIVNVPVNGTD